MKKTLLLSLFCSSLFFISCDSDTVSESERDSKQTTQQYESPVIDITDGTPINITIDIGRVSRHCRGLGICNVRPVEPTFPDFPDFPNAPIIVDFPNHDKFDVSNVVDIKDNMLSVIAKHNALKIGADGFVLKMNEGNQLNDSFVIEQDLTDKELPFVIKNGEYQYNKEIGGYIIDITRK